MRLRDANREVVSEQQVVTDEYGKTVGRADIELPDGTYDGTVVVDETRAIDFLLQSS